MESSGLLPLGVSVSATTLASKLAPQRPLTRSVQSIRYTPELLESIRLLCTASFVTDGAGVPILGLLYGTRLEDEISLTAWVPAGELRNYNDAEFALKLQMRLAAARPETAGLECLGWVRTRNYGEPRPVEEDLALFNRCFPTASQATMIVRPSFQKPAKAAFYLRGADGAVRADRPTQEFFLYPQAEAPALQRASQLAPQLAPSVARSAAPEEVASLPPAAHITPKATHQPTHQANQEVELLPQGTVRAFSPWIAAMLVLVGLLAGSGMAALRGRPESPQTALAASEPLRVGSEGDRWAIRWDKSLAELKGVSGAVVNVTRDNNTKSISLSLPQFAAGAFPLDWVSEDMEVTLRVDRPGYPEIEQRVRVIDTAKRP
jgi:hypothetical protein